MRPEGTCCRSRDPRARRLCGRRAGSTLRRRTSGRGGWMRSRPSPRRSRSTAATNVPVGWPGVEKKSTSTRADLVVAELDVARAGAVVAGRLRLAADPRDQLVGHDARRALGEHAGLRRADARHVAHRVDVREPRRERARIDRDPSVLRQAGRRRPPRARGAPGCRGTGRRAGACRRPARPRASPASSDATRGSGTNSMPRSANRARIASEVSGDGGTGAPNGITTWIWTSSRTPRARRYSSSRIAASLGAGGHLNGVPQTPTIAVPDGEARGARRARPRRPPPSRTRCRPRPAPASPPGRSRRPAPRPGRRPRRSRGRSSTRRGLGIDRGDGLLAEPDVRAS